jgi:hypothetical protein
MMAGDRVTADPGVAVKANAENATANAAAILGIVIITLSCAAIRRNPVHGLRAVLLFPFATSSVAQNCVREKPGASGNVSIRFAMTLVLLL